MLQPVPPSPNLIPSERECFRSALRQALYSGTYGEALCTALVLAIWTLRAPALLGRTVPIGDQWFISVVLPTALLVYGFIVYWWRCRDHGREPWVAEQRSLRRLAQCQAAAAPMGSRLRLAAATLQSGDDRFRPIAYALAMCFALLLLPSDAVVMVTILLMPIVWLAVATIGFACSSRCRELWFEEIGALGSRRSG